MKKTLNNDIDTEKLQSKQRENLQKFLCLFSAKLKFKLKFKKLNTFLDY